MDDIVDVIKFILALLFIFGPAVLRALKKLKGLQQGSPAPQGEEEARGEAEGDAEALVRQMLERVERRRGKEAAPAPARPAWRYDEPPGHEDAEEDAEDYDLHDELDTELDVERLDEHEDDDDLETHDELSARDDAPRDDYEERTQDEVASEGTGSLEVAAPVITNLEAAGFDAEGRESTPQAEALREELAVLEERAQGLRRRAEQVRAGEHRGLEAAQVRTLSFVRDAVVLDLLFRRRPSNPLFRAR